MQRLSIAALTRLPAHIEVPTYDREACGIGIVHLGIGAFHRAHQAVYTDDILAAHGGDWAIAGVSLRGRSVPDQLNPQQGLYSVTALAGSARHCRVIGAVRRVIFAPGERPELLALMAAPATRIVSLTVTEKGYYRDPASGRLLTGDPAIAADLAAPESPATAIGLLARALDLRRQAGLAPFTVLSCDNLPDNGKSLRRLLLEYAGLISPSLAGWIEDNVAFPGTMVDRIVPAMTDEGLTCVADDLGYADAGSVITEPFSQWVVEDNFPQGRPAWETAGAMLVEDVAPYELIKLRLLNGPHSAMAYLGYLGGLEYISDCMDNAPMRAFVAALMQEEIRPTLSAPGGFDLGAYIDDLLARFANPSLRHKCWQIAMDGSQKLPQRLLGTLAWRLQRGLPIDRLALAVAGWVHYAAGIDLEGNPIDVRDPMADRLAAGLAPHLDEPQALAGAALGIEEIFTPELAANAAFAGAVTESLAALKQYGALGAVSHLAPPG